MSFLKKLFGSSTTKMETPDDTTDSLDEEDVEPEEPEPEDVPEPEPGDDPPVSNRTSKYRRFGLYAIRKGSCRPEVWIASEALQSVGVDQKPVPRVDSALFERIKEWQRSVNLGDDGIIGKGTWTKLIDAATLTGYVPDLMRRCQTMVCQFETHRRDAYGMSENDIGDGAGANYGVVQHNKCGSMVTLLTRFASSAGPILAAYKSTNKTKVNYTVKAWMGTSAGIAAQDRYFKAVIYNRALRYMEELFGEGVADAWPLDVYERGVALMCDIVVQNGSPFSPWRKPFWKSFDKGDDPDNRELYTGERWDARFIGDGVPYALLKKEWLAKYDTTKGGKRARIKETNQHVMLKLVSMLGDPQNKLALVAQMRARSSSPKYWRDVLKRKQGIALGEGVVHGDSFSMFEDFGIGRMT